MLQDLSRFLAYLVSWVCVLLCKGTDISAMLILSIIQHITMLVSNHLMQSKTCNNHPRLPFTPAETDTHSSFYKCLLVVSTVET